LITLVHESDAGSCGTHDLEADRVADGRADLLAHLLGDPLGGEARGQAPRLEHDDLTIPHPTFEERWRHASGLARAGRRFDNETR